MIFYLLLNYAKDIKISFAIIIYRKFISVKDITIMFNYFTDDNFTIGQLIIITFLLLLLWFNVSGAVEDHNFNKTSSQDIIKIHKRISRIELYIASIIVVNLLKSVYSVANGR